MNEKTDSAIEQTEETSVAEEDQPKEPEQTASTSSSFINEEELNATNEETTINGTIDESTFSDADETVNETRDEVDEIEGQTSEEDSPPKAEDADVQQKSEPVEIPDDNHSEEGKLVKCTSIIISRFDE